MFDAREMKALTPGQHLTSPDYQGLRLEASASRRTWIYRYRSPIDNKLRQTKIGTWPALSVHAAITKWEELRRVRETGEDPALAAKELRLLKRVQAESAKQKSIAAGYTVADVAHDYWEGHVFPNRAEKGATEVGRMFDTMLGSTGGIPAQSLTRAQAFDLIKGHAGERPVVAGYLRSELGAAWEYAIDSGRLPESTPNWWRLILRGKVKSKGKKIAGQYVGTKKRALTPDEAGELIRWLPNFTRLIEDVLTVYLWTGCRGAEILTAEGKEINEEEDGNIWWTVPKEKTKNARHPDATDLRVPLFGRARSVMLRRKALSGEGYLFPARVKGRPAPVEQKTIQSTVWLHQPYSSTRPKVSRPRLPVTHWAPHDLRRTVRTFLASRGCPRDVGESILGHMLPGVQGVYNLHTFDAERVEWLGWLSNYLEELATGK